MYSLRREAVERGYTFIYDIDGAKVELEAFDHQYRCPRRSRQK